ncbi:hypothetical protein [Mangrovimonas cancribranchiae]|uniref:Glycerophosphoryl diester phosphodiesterase membrane domain-containing protein n=1 Tax=Mangrovimonas cancribranchiae TaxID=3080055 RepID=A0AAU6P5C9_9FLAO
MKQYIEFKKRRELGEILTDSFGFIRNEFKPFFKLILQICAPFLVLFLMSLTFYLYASGGVLDFQLGQTALPENLGLMFLALGLFAITGLITYVYANSTAIHYIKSYIKNHGQVEAIEVKQQVKQTFWGFTGLSILKWGTLFISMMLCILPVLYFMVPMFIVFCVFIFEDKNATDAYSYSYTLIKEDFWATWASIVVLGLIISVAGYAFGLPAGIYSMVKMGIFSGEVDPATMQESFIDPVYIILNIISYLFKFVLNLVLTIGAVLIYFNLNEKKNFTGTLERIDAIGKND